MVDRIDEQAVKTFARVPGIGPGLAARIVEQLGVKTLAGLRAAATDGRLQQVNGFGKRRVEQVAAALADEDPTSPPAETEREAGDEREEEEETAVNPQAELPRAEPAIPDTPTDPPAVDLLLALDAAYRRKAAAGELTEVDAPRRAHADESTTLPIMRQERGPWSFTVYFSTTVRAHQHDKTDDWVLISYEHQGQTQRNTVLTETEGPLAGKRVVRGGEEACADYYGISL